MVSFVPSICFSTRKSRRQRNCSELGNIQNRVKHCTFTLIYDFFYFDVHVNKFC